MEGMKIDNIDENQENILYKPDRSKIIQQFEENPNVVVYNPDNNMTMSMMNRSSMMTYSKIVCCVCSAVIDANARGMCSTCARSEVNITEGITKTGMLYYCKGCDRYQRPPWVRCGDNIESPEMMQMILSKIKGLSKVKLVDTSFVWTEPHSKMIKIKLTIQKEMNKTLIQTSFVVEFKVEWTQCDDCKKTFTPHIWNASVQIRQKVNHKRTFMLLEQMILKHKAHTKALNIKEHPEGVDFYFSNKSQAMSFSDFVMSMLPSRVKQSSRLISHDQHSNLYNYKYTFMIDLAPVCLDDLIVLEKDLSKELGGIGPVLICYKQASKVHLVDPLTFNVYDYDGSTYWKHGFKSFVDRECLIEFLIINVEEEIDYHKKYAKTPIESNLDVEMSLESNSKLNQSKSTNYKLTKKEAKNKTSSGYNPYIPFKLVNVQCIYNNTSKVDGDVKLFTLRSHLGGKIKPGDIFYGYDLTAMNFNMDLEDIIRKSDSIPDVILVKKKYQKSDKRIWKLKHLKKEVDVDMSGKNKNGEAYEKQYQEFVRDIEENKEMRKNVNLYRDDNAIKELESQFKGLKVKEHDDSDVDIKVEDLLEDLHLDDVPKKKDSIDFLHEEDDSEDEIPEKGKNKKVNPKEKQIGKRKRTGKKIEDD